jgi:hypothetical protein
MIDTARGARLKSADGCIGSPIVSRSTYPSLPLSCKAYPHAIDTWCNATDTMLTLRHAHHAMSYHPHHPRKAAGILRFILMLASASRV